MLGVWINGPTDVYCDNQRVVDSLSSLPQRMIQKKHSTFPQSVRGSSDVCNQILGKDRRGGELGRLIHKSPSNSYKENVFGIILLF